MSTPTFSVSGDQECVVIHHGRTIISLSKATGCLLEITDGATGKALCSVVERPHHGRLFRLVAMRRLQRGRAGDAHAQREIQWRCETDGVTITYPTLAFEGEASACSATVRIEPGADDELSFSMTVENLSSDPIHEIQFPMLPGWQQQDDHPPTELIAGAKWQSKVGKLPNFGYPAYCEWYQQVVVDYPGSAMYMPWLDIAGPNGSLAMVNYMERPYWGGIGGKNLAGHEKGTSECYWWRHYPLIRKGGSWSSPPLGIRVHDGDWHLTADRYYAWFKQAVGVELRQPEALRTSIGFQNILLRNFDGTPENPLDSLAEHAAAGIRHGVRDLVVWDSLSLGNYAIYEPDVDALTYPAGEREQLMQAIRQAQEAGATVSALINCRHINVQSKLYEEFKSEAVLCLDGSERRENWGGGTRTSAIFTPHLGMNCILLSPRSPKARQRIDRQLDKYLELGYTACFYDQPFLYCPDYNHMGDEDRPDDAAWACYTTIAQIRARLQARDAGAYIIGEQFDIFSASRAIDLHMEWNFTNTGIDALARVHYASPHALLSYVIDYLTAGESHASHAFAAGLLLCITIDGGESNLDKRPALAAHIAKLAALRQRCADRIAFGRFRHTDGLSCANAPGVVAYAYDSSHGPAVVIAAGAAGGQAAVTLDPSRFQPSSQPAGQLHLLNGNTRELGKSTRLTHDLAPNEVAVWYL